MIKELFSKLLTGSVRKYLWTALIVFIAILMISVYVLSKRVASVKYDRDRYKNNCEVYENSFEQIVIADSLQGVKIRQLELDNAELRAYNDGEVMKTLKNMDIRLRKMESFSTVATETTNNIQTFFKDSTRINQIPLETLDYSDRWFDITIRKEGLKATIKAVSRDSLIQVVYWERPGFFLFKPFKRKEYSQNIVSANPNSRIIYARYLVPEKLRKKK